MYTVPRFHYVAVHAEAVWGRPLPPRPGYLAITKQVYPEVSAMLARGSPCALLWLSILWRAWLCTVWPPRCHGGGGGSRQTWSVIARYPRTTWRRSSPYCDNVVCDRMGPVYMTRCSVAIETSGDIMHRVSTTRNMSTSTKSMSANIADVSSPRQPGQRTACAQTARREAPQRTLKPDCGGEWCG